MASSGLRFSVAVNWSRVTPGRSAPMLIAMSPLPLLTTSKRVGPAASGPADGRVVVDVLAVKVTVGAGPWAETMPAPPRASTTPAATTVATARISEPPPLDAGGAR